MMMSEGPEVFNRRMGWGGSEQDPSVGARPVRRVIVTGMGCVTPYGAGVAPFWDGLVSGRSAVGALTVFDPSPYSSRVAGEIRDFVPRDHMSAREANGSSRVVQLALAAARLAVADAGLSIARVDATRVGVFMGSSIGTFEYAAENHAVFLEKGIRRVHPLFPAQSYGGVVATQLAIALEIRGPAIAVSTACNSATDAIGLAWMYIRSGIIDRAIVGGAEAPLTPLLFASFDRLGVMSRYNDVPARASRPFARDRDGFVLAEGSGVCVLEAYDVACDRNAMLLAEVAGYAATSDAFHPFSPHPSGDDGVRAVRDALKAAGLRVADVSYVNAHAIGSRPNDPIEAEILKVVFGEGIQRIPVSAIKSMLGHTMGAAGALELISCVRSIQTSTIPPTVNLDEDDQELGLDLVIHRARRETLPIVLSTTFGFGARNGCLVVRSDQDLR